MPKLLTLLLVLNFSLQASVFAEQHCKLTSEQTSELPSEELPAEETDKEECEEEKNENILQHALHFCSPQAPLGPPLEIEKKYKAIYLELPQEPPELFI